jgi:hypothetical protein
LSFVNPNTCHLICNNFNLNFIFGIVCVFVCVCAFSLRRESPDMILGDKLLISEMVLSQWCSMGSWGVGTRGLDWMMLDEETGLHLKFGLEWVVRIPWPTTRLSPKWVRVFTFTTHRTCSCFRLRAIWVRARVFRVLDFGLGFYAWTKSAGRNLKIMCEAMLFTKEKKATLILWSYELMTFIFNSTH